MVLNHYLGGPVTHKVCVLLSGCGVFDGAEIHESVATLLALSKLVLVFCCAKSRSAPCSQSSRWHRNDGKRNIQVEAAVSLAGNDGRHRGQRQRY